MSSFGINLDLKLNGQSALDRAIRGTKTLESIVKRLKDTPLDLSNIGGAARLDEGRLGKARKGIIEFAQALAKQEEPLAKTEAGIREYVSAFNQLAANTKTGTPAFNAFVGVLAKAEKELEDIARATENARRAQLGLLSLEQEEEQKKRNEQLKRNIELRKKRKKAIDDEAKAQDRKNEKDAREAKREKEKQKREQRRKFTDIAAGVGFPLLFGGGPGAVAGGLAGGIAGGFGGSVLGGALGQQLDKLGVAAGKLGQALLKPTSNIDKLVQSLGISGSSLNSTIEVLQELGLESVASATAVDAFNDKFGVETANSLRALGKDFTEFQNALQTLGVRLAAFVSGPLSAFLNAVTAVAGSISNAEQARLLRNNVNEANRQQFDARLKELTGGAGFSGMISDESMRQLIEEFDPAAAKRRQEEAKTLREAEKQITEEIKRRVGIAKLEADVEKGRLTNRRDVQASLQAEVGVQQANNELARINLKIENETEATKLRILGLEKDLAEQAKERADAAKRNAVIEARRRIQREQISGAANQINAIKQEARLELEYQQGREGRFALFEAETKQLNSEFIANGLVLELERKRALIGVTEAERISSINRDYDLRVRLLEKEFDLNKQNLEQAKAAYDLSRLQVEQALKMERMQAGISAAQQIRATSPFEQEARLFDPFFGESAQLQIEQTLRYNENLALLGQQLDDVIAKQQIFALAPEVLQGLKDQENTIRNQIANFKEYQPAIDAAALSQTRFNEAMAITVPVTDAVFDNLLAVVDGTKTAEQAFADFLRSIASMLIDAAKQIIATYLAIGYARLFAGIPASGGGAPAGKTGTIPSLAPSLGGGGPLNDPKGLFAPVTLISGRALGGAVGAGRPYMVGERGPELFVPGAQGNIVPNNAMGSASVTVNVDASGSSVEGNADQASQLGKAIGIAVQAELVKQKRPGGLLAS